ncbi:hypothetical protein EDD37DRAFT_40860 [Exophiala viscosa]|uniref:uncharacterized protein n=1 Tax=Exophiala viscosa TaxID=2486360 RepID=UPI00219EA21A|nr:hypothetical protein EDD37DRAFT_40860 [Exophiala viscosa]
MLLNMGEMDLERAFTPAHSLPSTSLYPQQVTASTSGEGKRRPMEAGSTGIRYDTVTELKDVERMRHDIMSNRAKFWGLPPLLLRVPSHTTSGEPESALPVYISSQPSMSYSSRGQNEPHTEPTYPTSPDDNMLAGLARYDEASSNDDEPLLGDSCTISTLSTVESEGEASFINEPFSPPNTSNVECVGYPDVPISELVRGLVRDFLPTARTLMTDGPDTSISSASITASKGETSYGSGSEWTSLTTLSKRVRSSQDDGDDDDEELEGGRRPKRTPAQGDRGRPFLNGTTSSGLSSCQV